MIAFHDLEAGRDDALLEELHRDVLVPAFSVDELDDVATMQSGLRGDGDVQTLITVARGSDGALLGGIIGEIYRRSRVLLLSYLAVKAHERDKRIGAKLMRDATSRWLNDPRVELAVGEVHDPRFWPDTADERPSARLRFYERGGAHLLGIPFVQPRLRADLERIRGFLLITVGVTAGAAVPSALLDGFVRQYFEVAEGATEPYDDELAALLDRIDATPAVPVLPLAEYASVRPLDDRIDS